MRNLLILISIVISFIGCTKTIEKVNIIKIEPKTKISNMILKIPIYFKDKGYKNLKTQLIADEKTFNEFIEKVKKEKGWEKKDNFLEMIKNAQIDFDKENLLIYTFKEDKSVIVVAVDAPISKDNHIVVKIGKDRTKEKSGKMIYYALAYKVKKEANDIIFEDGESNITIKNIR